MGMFLRRGPAPHRTRMSDLEIRQFIRLNLNGTPWYWRVVHQGLPSSIYDASCDGTWLLMKDIYGQRLWDSGNTNKLESSTIHSYLNSDFLNLFDRNIQSAIKQVKIPYRQNGGTNGTDQSGANGLSVKVFLLSGYEVGFTTSDSRYFPVDGAKLDYFTASSSGNSKRIATFNDSPYGWWLRSPYDGNALSVWYVDSSGSRNRISSYQSYGVRSAIILPSDMRVTDDMLLPANIKTVSIIGDYFGYGYVMVGETKYKRTTEVFAEIGTTIVAHVGAPDSTGVAGCKIYFNGNLVETGNSSHSFTLKGNVTITFDRSDGSTSAIECYIVEQ